MKNDSKNAIEKENQVSGHRINNNIYNSNLYF